MELPLLDMSENRLYPLLLGVVIGLSVAIDPLATRFFEFGTPYLFTVFLFLIITGGVLLYCFQEFLLARRYQIVLILMIIGLQTTSIQAGIDIGELIIVTLVPLLLVDIWAGSDKKFLITPLTFMVVLFFMVIVASLTKDFNPLVIRKEIKAVVIFFLMLNLLHWSQLNNSLARWFIIITSCSAIFALMQEWIYLATGEVLVGNIDSISLKNMFEETALGSFFRVPAFTNGYREFALILSLSISLLTARLLYLPNCKRKYWILALFINLAAVSCTLAKDILLGLALGGAMLLFIYRPKFLWPAGIVTVSLAAVMALFLTTTPGGWDSTSELVQTIPGMERERMQLNREGIEGLIGSEDYLLGAGVNAKNRYTDHHQGWKAHNAFILVADAGGLLALTAYSAIFLWLIYRLICINLVVRSVEQLALARGLLMFFFVALIALQFTSEYIEMIFWMYAAIVETFAIQIMGFFPGRVSKMALEGGGFA